MSHEAATSPAYILRAEDWIDANAVTDYRHCLRRFSPAKSGREFPGRLGMLSAGLRATGRLNNLKSSSTLLLVTHVNFAILVASDHILFFMTEHDCISTVARVVKTIPLWRSGVCLPLSSWSNLSGIQIPLSRHLSISGPRSASFSDPPSLNTGTTIGYWCIIIYCKALQHNPESCALKVKCRKASLVSDADIYQKTLSRYQ